MFIQDIKTNGRLKEIPLTPMYCVFSSNETIKGRSVSEIDKTEVS